MRERD